jgi:SOUL heme-binding protein
MLHNEFSSSQHPSAVSPAFFCTLAVVLIAVIFPGERAMSIEMPDYTLVYKDGALEYRQYAAYLVAETEVTDRSDYSAAGDEGFRRLFRYITGANTNQSKIAMTAPVEQSAAGQKIAMTAPVEQAAAAGGWTVAFVVPRQYNIQSVPLPSNPQVRIREVPAELRAVLRYSGRWTEKQFNRRKTELLDLLAAAGVEAVGEVGTALYNPPYMPPFLRRNEVHVTVRALPAGVLAGN